jgi:hypothetical protein
MPDLRIRDGQQGQASIELIAGVPVLLMAGAIALQLLLAGYSLSLADGASEAGAAAAAAGKDPKEASHNALPSWALGRSRVEVSGGRVEVRIAPPAAVPAVSRLLAVESSAWARPDASLIGRP